MTDHEKLLDDVFNQLALELDIPPHKYRQALDRFEAIQRHLEAGGFPGSTPPPDVYLQGSFPLGTVIRPVGNGSDCGFDIDIVCEVDRMKEMDDPEALKGDVGAEVKAYAKKNGMSPPTNGKRCWALEYASDSDGIGFHVDILPSLPDPAYGAVISELNFDKGATAHHYTDSTIAITNRDEDFNPPEYGWRSSNPRGFARWFHEVCEPSLIHVEKEQQKTRLFNRYGQVKEFPYACAEDIPDALVRTPLQRAIQIMKRHRDVCFSGKSDEKYQPISMIITTLAAQLCQGRSSSIVSTHQALRFVVESLARHATLLNDDALARIMDPDLSQLHLIQRIDNQWYIPNPVNPHFPRDPDDKGENFADRWHEDNHGRARAFFRWVARLQSDLHAMFTSDSLDAMTESLGIAFGGSIATGTINRLSEEHTHDHVASATRVPSRFNVPHRERPKWPISGSHRVTISGRATRQNWRTRVSTDGFSPIPQGYSLEFKAKTNVNHPYEVHWQIVNTGSEAAAAGELRGMIVAGSITHTERTQYSGFHWVECFIVKDGVLVARSGEFVVNIE